MIYIVPGEATTQRLEPEHEPYRTEPSRPAGSDQWRMRTPDGRVYGPVPRQELDQWYQEGRVPREAALIQEGTDQWLAASALYPSLASRRPPLSEQNNPFSAPQFASETIRYQQPHRGAVILILAILGWFICPVFGPFAWAMGSSDLRAMRSGRMDPSGIPLTQAGMVLGLIQTVLLIFGFGLLCLGVLA
jgi:hypothetical protein